MNAWFDRILIVYLPGECVVHPQAVVASRRGE